MRSWRVAIHALCVAAWLGACAPANRGTSDAATQPGADASLCGNGVIDPPELCDEGPLNGTPQGTCTKQCYAATVSPRMVSSFGPLPLPVREAVEDGENGRVGYAFTDFSDAGLQFAIFNTDGSVRHIVALKVHGPAITLASLATQSVVGPLWVEQAVPGVGGPWMFYATFDASDVPTIHEVPYPFSDGARPEFVRMQGMQPLLVDQSSIGDHDLLITEVIAHLDTTVTTVTTRLTSAGAIRGTIVAPWYPWGDLIDHAQIPPGAGDVTRIVQFYDDTHMFQTVNIRPSTDADLQSLLGAYQVSEYARGSWPNRIVAGDGWVEVCNAESGDPQRLMQLTHPVPMAVISDEGDIFIWQFDHSPDSGELLQPFAHVMPGSIVEMPWTEFAFSDPNALWVLQPDGTQVYLSDGDNCDPSSPAIRPQIIAGTIAWTAAWLGENAFREGFATDATIHKLYPPE